MRRLLILLIRVYQYAISPYMAPSCRFTPTCSAYAIESVQKFGIFHGSWLAIRRIGRCHPWHEGGVDTVPEKKTEVTCSDHNVGNVPGQLSEKSSAGTTR